MLSLGTKICVHLDYEDCIAEGMSVNAAKNKIRNVWSLTRTEIDEILEEQEQFLKQSNLGELI